jgi:hypothetical protein
MPIPNWNGLHNAKPLTMDYQLENIVGPSYN